MHDRPTATELLADIADLLEGEVVPALRGPLQHQVRVAGNLCRIIERQLRLGPDLDAREAELLASLLDGGEAAADVAVLNTALAERLRRDRDPDLQRRAYPILLEIVKGKVAMAKPGHDSYDFAAEVGA